MPEDGERIARLEQQIVALSDDIDDRKHEEERTRDRLHKVEGLLGMLVDQQKQARRAEADQYRRLELRMQVLTLAIAAAAALEPLAYHFASH